MKRTQLVVTALILVATALLSPPLPAHPSTAFTVNSTVDPGTGVCDAAECTLREAVQAANALPGEDTIAFNIPGAAPHTIAPSSGLPAIKDPVIIDGTTQPGFGGRPLIELSGASDWSSTGGLIITGGQSTVQALVINRGGVLLEGTGGNLIVGNYIGTDVDGAVFLGGRVEIFSADNRIGGTEAGAGNVIAGGIDIYAGDGNIVVGNFIGTNADGTAALGYPANGVRIFGNGNTIGGTEAGAGNIISGSAHGIAIDAGDGNLVQGNFVGTDVTGTTALGGGGVLIVEGSGNTIGGTAPGARNVISGNGGYGVLIADGPTDNNVVEGNYIGTQVDGRSPLGNGGHGVLVVEGRNSRIGGEAEGEGNRIAFNGGAGVAAAIGGGNAIGRGNAILANSIFANGGLGIDLEDDLRNNAVTPNDPGDADTGANDLQNFPVLGLARFGGGRTAVHGTLSSAANTRFTLQFFANASCDPSGYGEGEVLAGSATLTTDNSGEVRFRVVLRVSVPGRRFITATATDPDGNTSEFSRCVPVRGSPRAD